MSMDEPAIATGSRAGIRAWKLWTEPPKFVVYWGATTAAAVCLTVVTAVIVPPTSRDLLWLGVLAVFGVGQSEAGRHIERRRRVMVDGPHINLTSVWTFAGVLLLPPALAAVLVAMLYGHLAARSWRRLPTAPPHRTIGNAGNASLSCFAAYGVMTWTGIRGIDDASALGPAGVVNLGAAILAYFVVAAMIAVPGVWSAEHTMKGLVAAAIPGRRAADHTLKELFGGFAANALEFTTLGAGALVALALASSLWPLAVFGAFLMVWVHKGVLDRQLDLLGDLDRTTGLHNLKGWYKVAAEVLGRASRDHGSGAVLMIEIDKFGYLNKGYSRLAGDDVLAAVADTVSAAVGDRGAVGRFTGPELFVVVLHDTAEQDAVKIAELIRTEVAWMRVPVLTVHGRTDVIRGISVSIGLAAFPARGLLIHKLLNDADTALQEARQFGGNQLRIA